MNNKGRIKTGLKPRKMQDVNFKSIDEFLAYLPDNELKIVAFLRKVILDCMPECEEKLAYNVPFYYLHSRVLYIWPAAVTWGNVKPKNVTIGFCKGQLLTDEIGYLDKANRKEMATKTFASIKEIDVELLRSYIYEAIILDEAAPKKRRSGI